MSVTRAFDSANIVYTIVADTLLGSWRHHCLAPWDDNIVLLVHPDNRSAILRLFGNSTSAPPTNNFSVLTMSSNSVQGDKRIPDFVFQLRDGAFPTLDVFLGVENDESLQIWANLQWEHLLPAVRRPLCGYWFYTPRNSALVLRTLFGPRFESECQTKVLS